MTIESPTQKSPRSPADTAYRRSWWALALYPFAFAGAFVVGEGLFSALDDGVGDPSLGVMLAAGVPALLVFAIPALVSWLFGRRAVRLGRPDGLKAAAVGAIVAGAFVALNLLSGLLQLLAG